MMPSSSMSAATFHFRERRGQDPNDPLVRAVTRLGQKPEVLMFRRVGPG